VSLALSTYILDMLKEVKKDIKHVKKYLGEKYDFNTLIRDYNFDKV